MSKGILLVNLGSPDSPSVPDVRKYLREFLMDGRVLDVAWPIRFCIVNFAILPKRPAQSAEAYHTIWTPAGSPLIVTSQNLRSKLADRVSVPVELAMRYQNPSIESAIRKLASDGIDEILLIPLFPHYAMSSYETAVERVKEVARALAPEMRVLVQSPYYAAPDYIDALYSATEPYLQKDFDLLLFSFHGVPERQIKKSDPTSRHCLQSPDCCQKPSLAHATCYRAQCFRTAAALRERAGLPTSKCAVSFQSRLGKDPWLKPYTDFELERLAKEGIRKLLVICPAFVSDCLETLEEIGMRGRETFLQHGGQEYTMVPCLNEHPAWISVLERMVNEFLHDPAAPQRPNRTVVGARKD